MESVRLLTRAVYCHVEGRRNQGRQPDRRIEIVKKYLEDWQMNLEAAFGLAVDRIWKYLVSASFNIMLVKEIRQI